MLSRVTLEPQALPPSSDPGLDVTGDPLQRRTLTTLIGGQIIGAIGVSSGIAVGSLLAAQVSGSEKYAGLSGTFQVLGGALAALVVARVMAARGRRPGLMLGYAIGTVGAAVIIGAALIGNFPLLLAGSILFGGATASNSQARFAAADLSAPAHRGRHISIVVWATTIGAVFGPNLTEPGAWIARRTHLPELAGPFVFSLLGFVVAGLLLWIRLRPDPLLAARERAAAALPEGSAATPLRARTAHGGLRRGLSAIAEHRAALLGITAMALGHAVMVSVMVMTPLHMRHGHADLQIIGFVISLHIVGMYALSPVTGWAVDRFGARVVIAIGSGLLIGASALAATSEKGASSHLTIALILLGLGWSCTLVAGSTLLTGALDLDDRPAGQGVADVAMGLAGGGGGALAGVVVDQQGFSALAIGAGLLAGLIGIAAATIKERPAGAGDRPAQV